MDISHRCEQNPLKWATAIVVLRTRNVWTAKMYLGVHWLVWASLWQRGLTLAEREWVREDNTPKKNM